MSEIERATNARNQLQESRNRLVDEMTKEGCGGGAGKTTSAATAAAAAVSSSASSSTRQQAEAERHYNYRMGKDARSGSGRHRSDVFDEQNRENNNHANNNEDEFMGASFKSSSEFYDLSKNSKRWRSMYALRDSIRNLTSCVSTKASYLQANK